MTCPPYQVNQKLMDNAAGQIHALPARLPGMDAISKGNGRTVSSRTRWRSPTGVFEGPASIVFDEAENRMHTIKAVMAATL